MSIPENLLEEFLSLYTESIRKKLESATVDLIRDDSEYHIVDGEEGDYGIVKYFVGHEHVATYINNGGDDERVDFTAFGWLWMKEQLE